MDDLTKANPYENNFANKQLFFNSEAFANVMSPEMKKTKSNPKESGSAQNCFICDLQVFNHHDSDHDCLRDLLNIVKNLQSEIKELKN